MSLYVILDIWSNTTSVTHDIYKAALEQAKADFLAAQRLLMEYRQKQEELEMGLGNLRETIAALCRISGEEFVEDNAPGMTDAIRLAFKMAPGQPMTAPDVKERLGEMGYDLNDYHNVLASIHSVLKRLEAKHEIQKSSIISGKTAYTWMPRLGFRPFHRARSKIKDSK